jgi:hypothetical protein
LTFAGRLIWDAPPPKPGANISLIPYAIGGYSLDYLRDPNSLEINTKTGEGTSNFGGDTVNTASRIETSGIANKINISEAFRAQVEPTFQCSYRGRVALKNKGEMDLYFLDGQRTQS